MKISEAGVKEASTRFLNTPSSSAEKLFLYPTRFGHYECDQRYQFSYQSDVAKHSSHHLHYMLMYIKKGRLDITVEQTKSIASTNEIVLFDCKNTHEYRADCDDLSFDWLVFNGEQCPRFYERILSLRQNAHVFHLTDVTPISLGFSRMLALAEKHGRPPENIYSECIYSMLCHLLTVGSAAESEFDSLIRKATAFMDHEFARSLSVEDIASHVGLSASYLTKQFRAYTGYSPHEYLTLCRIGHAKELLSYTSLPIKKITYECGFNSEENFIRAFNKKVGVSPSTYRRYPV